MLLALDTTLAWLLTSRMYCLHVPVQVDQYVASAVPAGEAADSLFVLYSGSNDLAGITLGLSEATPLDMIRAYKVAVGKLYKAGARRYLTHTPPHPIFKLSMELHKRRTECIKLLQWEHACCSVCRYVQ